MEKENKDLLTALLPLAAFAAWTILIQVVDVQPAGQNGTEIGFAAFNLWFHRITGVHMVLYTITDWLGLVPILICLCFGVLGLSQWIGRRSLLRVDADLILLGIFYAAVIFCYLFFETVPINYRPVLIGGVLEASYPSSTTLLVLSVTPTLKYQVDRRSDNDLVRKITTGASILFPAFMVLGRLVSGVHWATDIIGSVLLSAGLFMLYRFAVGLTEWHREGSLWSSTKSCRN